MIGMKEIRKDKGAGVSQSDEKAASGGDEFQSSGRVTDKVRDTYLKALRRMSRKHATMVRLPIGELHQRIEWSRGRGSGITEIPKITNPNIEVTDIYPVNDPYSYIRVTLNNENSEYLLESIEPKLEEKESKLLKLVKDTLERTLGYEWEKLTQFDKDKYLSQAVDAR
jgi:flagellar protein FlaI